MLFQCHRESEIHARQCSASSSGRCRRFSCKLLFIVKIPDAANSLQCDLSNEVQQEWQKKKWACFANEGKLCQLFTKNSVFAPTPNSIDVEREEREAIVLFILSCSPHSVWHLIETMDHIVSDLPLIKKGHYFVWQLDCLRGKKAVVRFSPHTQTEYALR